MLKRLTLLLAPIAIGCAPRQDPGIPLPPPSSGAAAFRTADQAVAVQADTASAIESAQKLVANNIVNVETTAFKSVDCRVERGRTAIFINMTQGPVRTTYRPLDVAINGNGFFRVKTDENSGSGYAYTRVGNLFVTQDERLVVGVGEGHPIDPPVSIPRDALDINISHEGVISVLRAKATERQTVGRINLYQFKSPQDLAHDGDSLFRRTPAAGDAIECKPTQNATGTLQQGLLEGSNVDLNRETLRMQFLARWYAAVLNERKS